MQKLKKQFLRFLFLLLLPFYSSASAQDSCTVQISLLTCAPGEELYSTFGHTALRVTDKWRGIDVVFNYGTFDFSDPNFYTKFVRGKLNYFLSVENYPDFIYTYVAEQRSVTEQVLNLTCSQKQQLIQALQINMQEENRYYKYDFLFDNCTTRVRDLLFHYADSLQLKNEIIPSHTSHRNLIHEYLDAGGKEWSKLGIDILLGSKVDKPISSYEAMFLPDYLMKGIDSAVTNNTRFIVLHKNEILSYASASNKTGYYTPLIIVTIVCCIFLICFIVYKKYSIFIKILDALLLYLSGLLGLLISFMWFGTDHIVCQNNWNILWAFPLHFFAAFFIGKVHSWHWLQKYFLLSFFLNLIVLIGWLWLPQQFNIAILPFVLLLSFRYGKLAYS